MIGESFAIVVVLAVTAIMGVRNGKAGLAPLTLPFLCLPASVLIGAAIYYSFGTGSGFRPQTIRLVSAVVGAVLGSALCILVANLIVPKKARLAFIIGCLLFLILMALAYILPILA